MARGVRGRLWPPRCPVAPEAAGVLQQRLLVCVARAPPVQATPRALGVAAVCPKAVVRVVGAAGGQGLGVYVVRVWVACVVPAHSVVGRCGVLNLRTLGPLAYWGVGPSHPGPENTRFCWLGSSPPRGAEAGEALMKQVQGETPPPGTSGLAIVPCMAPGHGWPCRPAEGRGHLACGHLRPPSRIRHVDTARPMRCATVCGRAACTQQRNAETSSSPGLWCSGWSSGCARSPRTPPHTGFVGS